MPILVPVEELRPGMCLGSNVVNNFAVLLPHGHELTEDNLANLERLIPGQSVQIVSPSLDGVADFEDITKAQIVSQTIREKSATVIDRIDAIVRAGRTLGDHDIAEINRAMHGAVKYLTENSVTMALIEQSKNWDNYLQEHSSNVFYLSILIGNSVRTYIRSERNRLSAAHNISNVTDLRPLATAALFHDIGMVKLAYLYHKDGPLSDAEKQALLKHPQIGAKILPKTISSIARASIRSHHENRQGTGYPDGLAGESIGVFARIIRIADAYCSATTDTAVHQGRLPAIVLYEMLYGHCKEFYDPELLAVFGTLMPPFPVGAKLKLHDGRYAVVVRHNRQAPFRPEVIIAFDEYGRQLSTEQIEPPFNMGDRNEARIDSFAGEDMSFLNEHLYDLPAQQNYDVALNFAYP